MASRIINSPPVGPNFSLWENIKIQLNNHGLIGLVILIATIINWWTSTTYSGIIDRANKQMELSNRQAEINFQLGILQGKMDILTQDPKDKETSSNSAEPRQ